MKLSADKNHPDYHDVVHFIDKITVDGQVLTHCVHVDTVLNEAQCITQPTTIENDHMKTHVVRGKLNIIWREGTGRIFAYLKKDWESKANHEN